MKKTRPHGAVGFEHYGYPRSVASRRCGFGYSMICAEMIHDTPQLFRRLPHEPFAGFLIDQRLNLSFKLGNFVRRRSNHCLSLRRPRFGTVECGRRHVRSEKRNGSKAQIACGFDRFAQSREVSTLHRAARRNRKFAPKRAHSGTHLAICAGHAANRVVDVRRTIERNDHIIDRLDDSPRVPR